MKKTIVAAAAVLVTCGTMAQNATNSPYSRYGYGQLADQSNGASVAMSGLSMGWREGNTVNSGNPASYSALDSITFVFDAGISGQIATFKENGRRLNANNTSFDYMVGAFRLLRHLGLGFGVLPYSNVGYSYYNSADLGSNLTTSDTKTTTTNTYSGSGGFHQIFLGLAWEPISLKNTSISFGVNASYMWGNYTNSVVNSYSDSYVNTLSKYYYANINSYKLDFGVQIRQRLTKDDVLTVGATYSGGHDLKSDPYCMILSYNSQTGVSDTTTYNANGQLALPTTFGAGFVWNHKNKLRVGADWKMEKWEKLLYPMYEVDDNEVPSYTMQSGQFMDRQRFIFGAEYTPKENSRRWRGRVKYRVGFTYATPYLRVNKQDGPREIGASVGVGIPIMNSYNNRSILNLSASWQQQNATGLINEHTFRINIGLTFNERWFAKWQVE